MTTGKSHPNGSQHDIATATRQHIRKLSTLPPLPRQSQELLQLLFDPDLNMLSLAELVEHTPALAARIIGVANSAFFCPKAPVEEVPDAIIRVLGLSLVRDLSVSFVLNQPFDLEVCTRFQSLRFWVSAMESAVLTQILATQLPLRRPPTGSVAYLGGLLHKLGLLALVHVAPEAMDHAFSKLALQPQTSLRSLEQEILGIDHDAAGAELASVWNLPPILARVMGPLGDADDSDELATLASLLTLSGQIRAAEKNQEDVTQDTNAEQLLIALGVGMNALPPLLSKWHEDTSDITTLAAAFAR